MHPYYIGMILNGFIILPAIIGIARFREMKKAYYPLVYLTWFTTITYILKNILAFTIRDNSIGFNIHALGEGIIILMIFKEWKLFKNRIKLFNWVLGVYIFFWIIYFLGFGLINTFYSHFEIFRHFILVFLTVHLLNSMISNPEISLLKDARFYTCLGFLIYFILNCTTSAFWIFNLEIGSVYRFPLSFIVNATHALYYILLGIAILIVPKRQTFILNREFINSKKIISA